MARLALSGRPPVVLTGGLVLREWQDSDVLLMPGLFDDLDVARWTPLESPFDLAAAGRYLAKARAQRATGTALHLAVTTDGTTPLGEVLVFVPPEGSDGHPELAELGYSIGPAYRGRGLALRALALLVAAAPDLGARHFHLLIAPGNAPSRRVAAAAGATRPPGPLAVRESPSGPVELELWELHS
jgi:RimJ/RimL family protein N-acetyltransferase